MGAGCVPRELQGLGHIESPMGRQRPQEAFSQVGPGNKQEEPFCPSPSLCSNWGALRLFPAGAWAALSIGQRGHNLLVLTCQLCCQLINLPLDVPSSALAFSQPQFTAPLKRMGELNK